MRLRLGIALCVVAVFIARARCGVEMIDRSLAVFGIALTIAFFIAPMRWPKLPKVLLDVCLAIGCIAIGIAVAPFVYLPSPQVALNSAAPDYGDALISYGMLATAAQSLTFKLYKPETLTGEKGGKIVVDGERLRDLAAKNYKLMGVCFHWDGSKDPLDTTGMSRSGLFDIDDRQIEIVIPWSDAYTAELVSGAKMTNYALLIVPPAISSDQFETLRQAKGLGVIIVGPHGGPP